MYIYYSVIMILGESIFPVPHLASVIFGFIIVWAHERIPQSFLNNLDTNYHKNYAKLIQGYCCQSLPHINNPFYRLTCWNFGVFTRHEKIRLSSISLMLVCVEATAWRHSQGITPTKPRAFVYIDQSRKGAWQISVHWKHICAIMLNQAWSRLIKYAQPLGRS